jgi:Tol biopolymer transport system component
MANITLTRASTAAVGDVAGLATISADGRFAFYFDEGQGGAFHRLQRVDLSTGDVQVVATASGQDGFQGSSFACSADGGVVTYTIGSQGTASIANVFAKNLNTGNVTVVSSSNGTPENAYSLGSGISADGRFVAFESEASDLVPGDTNNARDAFIKDLQTGDITRVQTAAFGVVFSPDGKTILYEDGVISQFFTKNLVTGAISPVKGFVQDASFSQDGRFLVFVSNLALTPSDTNGVNDVYVLDLQTGKYTLVSTASDGTLGNGASGAPSISADGQRVAFVSAADNFFVGDTNLQPDVFVKDIATGLLTHIGSRGQQNFFSETSISADGNKVGFTTRDNFPLKGDLNGLDDAYVATFLPPTLTIGVIAGDGRISAAEAASPLTVSGTSDAIGRLVTVTDDFAGPFGPDTRFAAVQPNGTWSTTFSVAGLADGGHTYSASVVDDTGLIQNASRTVLLDRIPPALAISSVAGDDVINAAEAPAAVVLGTSNAFGQTVTVTVDGVFAGIAFVQGDGTWSLSFDATALANGAHSFGATVSDLAGNQSTASRPVTVATIRPVVDILVVSGDDVIDGTDVLTAVPIDGTSGSVGQIVQLSIDGTPAGTAVVQADGTWHQTLDFSAISGNTHAVQASVSDAAGNVGTDTETVLYNFPVQRESTTATGAQGTGDLDNLGFTNPTASGDGRYIVFEAIRAGLVANEDNSFFSQIYLKDALTGAVKIISTTPDGVPFKHTASFLPSISADANYIAFTANPDRTVPGLIGGLLRYNRTTGAIEIVDGAGGGFAPLSADGRYIAFVGGSSGQDVYLKDMQTGDVKLVAANGGIPSMSADGRYVAYVADESTNPKVFVWDRDTGTTRLVSADANGVAANALSGGPVISPDGSLVAFYSSATNLVSGPAPPTGGYIKNLATGAVTLFAQMSGIAVDLTNFGADPGFRFGSFSADDRTLAFTTIGGDSNGRHLFSDDLQIGTVRQMTTGNGFAAEAVDPTLTRDGRSVVFADGSPNLVPGDTNGLPDIFRMPLTPHNLSIALAGGGIVTAAEAGAPVDIHGTSDVIGGAVRVLIDGVPAATATVAADGTWSTSVAVASLAQGRQSILATVSDSAGGTASAGTFVTVHTIVPTVTITSDKAHLNAGETATITFKFNEQVTGLDSSDYLVTGGSLSGLGFVDAHTVTGVFTPALGVHTATIQLPANAFTDLAGNFNSAASLVLGLAIDGYIVGATVFADANHNGVLDPGEAAAITDASGGFAVSGGAGPLVMTGGIDIGTGLPFAGKLTAPAGASVITPLTTLLDVLEGQGVPNAQAKLLSALGLDAGLDLVNLDPIPLAVGGDANAKAAFAAGAVVLDSVSLTAAAIAGGDTTKYAAALQDGFVALANVIASAGLPLDPADPVQITNLVNNTVALAGASLDPKVIAGLAEVIAALNGAVVTAAHKSGADALAGITAAERIAQGAASDAFRGVGNDPAKLPPIIAAYSDHVGFFVGAAQSQIGDVVGPNIQTPPHAVDDTYTTAENTPLAVAASGVLGNDIEVNGHVLSGILVSGPQHGGLTFNADGSFNYTPNDKFFGSDSFSYKDNDGAADSNAATVTILVAKETTPPVLTPVADQTDEATSPAGAAAVFAATASDNIDGTDPVVFREGNIVVHSGDTFGLGTHAITASATDAAGNTSSETFTVKVVDTTAPSLTAVPTASPANGDLNAGKKVVLTVRFSEAVTVAGGIPILKLNDGGKASYTTGSGTSALTFTYAVAAGQNTPDLAVTGITLNGATIRDGAGNDAALSGAVTNPAGILKIDTTMPTVTNVLSLPFSGVVTTGHSVLIALVMSEPVTVAGAPVLLLNDGGVAKFDGLVSFLNALVFDYTVLPSQATKDLRIAGIKLPSPSSIHDLAGNNADLSAAGADLRLRINTAANGHVGSSGGNFTKSDSREIELFGASTASVTFAPGDTGILRLDASSQFNGTIAGLAPANYLDLADIAFGPNTKVGFTPNGGNSGGMLKTTDGSHTATIALLGQYMASSFVAASDGHGGTFIAAPHPDQQLMLVKPSA